MSLKSHRKSCASFYPIFSIESCLHPFRRFQCLVSFHNRSHSLELWRPRKERANLGRISSKIRGSSSNWDSKWNSKGFRWRPRVAYLRIEPLPMNCNCKSGLFSHLRHDCMKNKDCKHLGGRNIRRRYSRACAKWARNGIHRVSGTYLGLRDRSKQPN